MTNRRTMRDWAHMIQDLVDVYYPDAVVIRLVESHHTPKHGSSLNMAKIELAVLVRQCLDRRIPGVETLRAETAGWEAEHNQQSVTVDWHFTTDAPRHRLKRLYPTYAA